MEQGELSASPDLQDSPGVRLGEDSELEEEEITAKHEGDEDDGLDIKPPQTHAGRKDRHKHGKHKEDYRRDKDSVRSESSSYARDRSTDRHKEGREVREASREASREAGREARDKEKWRGSSKTGTDREVEDKRREKSRRERERLERLERERYRLEREAARREQEHQERLRAAEREKDRAERQRRKEDAHDHRRRLVDESRRDRSRDKHSSRDRSRSPSSKHYRDRPARSHRPDDDRAEEEKESEGKDEDVEVLDELPAPHRREDTDIQSPSGEEESADSESESSDSEKHSEEDMGDSEHEPPSPHREPSGKFRSKFDDHSSGAESAKESVSEEEREEEPGMYLDESPPQSPLELKPELSPYYPALQGCRNVEEFHCLNKIEEGTYGVVFRAKDKKADEIVALKKLKMEKEKEGFPITSLREINTLLKAQHTNIVTVREIVVGSNIDKIYIVMDYVEHDLKSLMETMKEPFMIGEVKTLMLQLLRGVNHLHDNWIIHRDLKTSNLLLSHKGILKIGDFGLAREYGSPLRQYTPIVVTLWYRAPELLLGCNEYSTPIDMWSVGCIFAEFLTRKPLFPGKSDLDELNRIFKELGTPNEKIWPGVSKLPGMKKCSFAEHPYNQLRNRFGSSLSDKGFDLMNRFLTYDPVRRITADVGINHEYFQQDPQPVPPSMFPTWPAKSEMPRRTHGNSPKPPSGGKAYAKLLGDDDEIKGFHLGPPTKGAAATGQGFNLKF